MRQPLWGFIERLQAVASLEALQRLILDLRSAYEVEHVVYHAVNAEGGQYAVLTYPPAWVDRYIARDYARLDPVVQGCYRRFTPVDWKALDWTPRPVRAFLGEAIEHGVGNQGLSVPIRGPGGQFALFTISHRARDGDWLRLAGRNQGDLILIAHYINQKALEIARGTDALRQAALSPRETDALTLLAMGYSRARAADSLAISEHTLRAYVESARLKLGAANTIQAVATALTRGLLVV
ncbi:MAG: LuxR family transcriptional regulator [Rhodobacteraceae bacterium]|nr:LuxR family transcriptional regulator [Paracoccaceae bacterium]